jgi:RHS repeat-associated protein
MDGPNSGAGGASLDDPVNLANGQETYSPEPDLTAYNPVGPSAAYRRTYYTGAAAIAWASPGLPSGWLDNFDYSITVGADTLRLIDPRGAIETLTPQINGSNYTGAFQQASDDPFVINGTLRSGMSGTSNLDGAWDSISITFVNGQKWTFSHTPANQGNLYLSKITDVFGKSIFINRYADGRIDTITNDASTTLLSFEYDARRLTSVDGPNGTFVDYDYAPDSTTGRYLLSAVTQISRPAMAGPYIRAQYAYVDSATAIGGTTVQLPYLSQITVPSPTGTGLSTATIAYDSQRRVTSLCDANDNLREYAYSPTEFVDPKNAGRQATKVTVKGPKDANNNRAIVKWWYQTFKDAPNGIGHDNTGIVDQDLIHGTLIVRDSTCSCDRVTSTTDRNGHVTSYSYDPTSGRVLTVQSPYASGDSRNLVTTYTWTYPTGMPFGRLNSVQHGAKAATSFVYGSANPFVVTEVDTPGPNGSGATTVETDYTYDSLGNVTSIAGPFRQGHPEDSHVVVTANYVQDGTYTQAACVGEPLAVTEGTGSAAPITHYRFNTDGTLQTISDSAGHSTRYITNAARQVTKVVYPATGAQGPYQARSVYTYLYPGGPLTDVSSYDESTQTDTSSGSEPLTIAPLASVHFSYGPEGELLSQTGDTAPVACTYDPLYRTASVRDGNALVNGVFPSTVDPTKSTRYTYTWNNQYDTWTVAMTDPKQQSCSAVIGFQPRLDGSGSDTVVTRTDFRGNTQYVFGGQNGELSTIDYPTGTAGLALTYDAYGRLCTMNDGSGSTTYQYDDLDNVNSITTAYQGISPQVVQYAYYPDGSRKQMGAPGMWLNYSYDTAGRLTEIDDSESGFSVTWGYTRNNQLASATSPVNNTTYTYNACGLLSSLQTMGSTMEVQQFGASFTYDGIGNRLTDARNYNTQLPPLRMMATFLNPNSPSGSTTYQYHPDNLTHPYGYLFKETSTRFGGYTNSNAYDAASNLTTLRGSSAAFDQDNQNTVFSYDAAGNPTTYRNLSGNPVSLTFDAENRLTSFGSALQCGYNGFGLRTWKRTGTSGPKTYFLYDGMQPIVELDATGAVTYINTFGPTGILCRTADPDWNPVHGYHTFDPSGNLASLNSDPWGGDTEGFDAFGNPSNPNTGTPFQYQGQWGGYTDSETGLVLQGHRYYDPATGTWLTRDPIGYSGGVNLYAYCGNNPVNYADPSGTFWGLGSAGMGAVVGGVGALVVSVADGLYNGNLNARSVIADTAGGIAAGGTMGALITGDVVTAGAIEVVSAAVLSAGVGEGVKFNILDATNPNRHDYPQTPWVDPSTPILPIPYLAVPPVPPVYGPPSQPGRSDTLSGGLPQVPAAQSCPGGGPDSGPGNNPFGIPEVLWPFYPGLTNNCPGGAG